jgi:MFS transporter, FSR family, fosmidomycin resistance protein
MALPSRQSLQVLGLVSVAHGTSHFYLLMLPPLFPILRDELGVGYAALGFLITLSNIATGTAQIPVGALADRYGARGFLQGGLAVMGCAALLMSLAPDYGTLVVLVLVAGIGNSVFHPVDYAILSTRVEESWIGRAFSVHVFAGHVGLIFAPPVMILVTSLAGWRAALATGGVLILLVLAVVVAFGGPLRDDPAVRRQAAAEARTSGSGAFGAMLTPPILVLFVFYVATAMVMAGMQTFSVTALVGWQGIDLAAANTALTAFLVAGALGVLLGGMVADRTRRHALVTIAVLLLSAILMLIVALLLLPVVLLVTLFALIGVLQSSTRPLRDMMVRAATPPGARARVFGFVMTGLNVGAAITPLLFGMMLDLGEPRWVFLAVTLCFLLAVASVLVVGRMAAALPAAAE